MRRFVLPFLLLAACSHREKVEVPKACNGDDDFVLVLGHVKNPGKIGLQKDARVTDAVSASGGFDPVAYPNGTTLTRKTCDGRSVRVRVPIHRIADGEVDDVAVAPGDIIMVPSREL